MRAVVFSHSLEQLMDFRNSIVKVAYSPAEAYPAALGTAAEKTFPSHLNNFETFLKGDWLLPSAGA